MKWLKGTLLIVFINLISWLMFILSDLISETYNIEIVGIFQLIIPLLVGIIYLCKETKFIAKLSISKIKFRVLSFFSWVLSSLLTGLYICYKVNCGTWFIEQKCDSWFICLNGLEYFVFSFLNLIVPIVVVLILNLIIFIIKKVRFSKYETKVK